MRHPTASLVTLKNLVLFLDEIFIIFIFCVLQVFITSQRNNLRPCQFSLLLLFYFFSYWSDCYSSFCLVLI